MKIQSLALPLAAVALLAWAFYRYGWGGLVAALGALLLWLLLHWTQTMRVLQRAARRPIGSVGSAVMLHTKLRTGMTLLHVTALTRALGQALPADAADTENWSWQDESGAQVKCEFQRGKLKRWQLLRLPPDRGPLLIEPAPGP